MEPPPNSSTRSEAERLFAEYLERLERGEEADLEVLCATHPEQGDELRRLERRLSAFHAAANQGPVSLFRGRGEGEKAVPGPWDVAEGRVLGDYRLVERIGRGGMGEVWEAEQISLNRRVALKLLLPERVDSRGLDFFAREARAGGKLSHPGIVAVHATGEDDGLHWIAMELVEEGCDLRRSLDGFREEGELGADYYRHVAEFVAELTDALEAAHTAGVIHRDLKPGNILVTRDDRPKLTDFGLAKVMDERSLSVVGEMAGTYYYMSPEQIAAKRAGIDHRTDVFSLGVVLYEMLTLAKPFEGDTTEQVAQKILWEEPPSPLELRSKVPLDLTVICLKALEKSPVQRFQSMADLGDDLNRWLCHEPIEARPPTAIQRVAKWTRRNPVKSVASTLTSVALIIVSLLLADNIEQRRDLSVALEDRSVALVDRGIALEQAVEAREGADQAATEAKEEAETTKQVLDFMVGLFEISDPSEARGETITAREILDRGVNQIDEELKGEPLIKARLQEVMGSVYHSLGLYPIAEPLLEGSLAAWREHLGDDHPKTLRSLNNLAFTYYAQGRYAEAEPLYLEGLEKSRHVLGDDHPDTLVSLGNLVILYVSQGRYDEAEPLYLELLEKQRRILGDDDPEMIRSLNNLALLYHDQGRYAEAEPLYLEALEKGRRILGDDHPNTIGFLNNLAVLYVSQGRYDEAEPLYLEALEKRRRVLGDDHPNTLASLNNLALLYEDQGRFDEAEPLYLEALEKSRRILGDDHLGTLSVLHNLANLYKDQGRFDEAETLCLEALEKRRRVLGDDHPETFSVLNSLASLYSNQGRTSEAEPLYLETLEKSRRILGDNHPTTLRFLHNLAFLFRRQGRLDEAVPLARELLQRASETDRNYEMYKGLYDSIMEQSGKGIGPSAIQLNNRAWSLIDPDRTNKETDVSLGMRLARAAADAAPEISSIHDTLAWALFANGLYEEAVAASKTALELAPEAEKDAYQGKIDHLRSMIAEAQQQPAGAGTGD